MTFMTRYIPGEWLCEFRVVANIVAAECVPIDVPDPESARALGEIEDVAPQPTLFRLQPQLLSRVSAIEEPNPKPRWYDLLATLSNVLDKILNFSYLPKTANCVTFPEK